MWEYLKKVIQYLYHWTTLVDILVYIVLLGIPLALMHRDIFEGWYAVAIFLSGASLIQANRNWLRSVRNRS